MSITVDGGWSEWQKWSPCSAICDMGTRYRIRSCSRPEPEGSGRQCEGETVQTNICYVRPCKGVKTINNNLLFGIIILS